MENSKDFSLFHRVAQTELPESLFLIVEIGQGDYNKYEYSHELGALVLDRVLYGPLFYPVNYCDVPGTWNEHDGDPLDAVLFSTAPITPGAIAKGRIIGAVEMVDKGEIDHKIICVNAKDPRFEHVKSVNDLTPYQKKDLVTFFELYKIPQEGKQVVEVGKFMEYEEAYKFIEECVAGYKKKFGEK